MKKGSLLGVIMGVSSLFLAASPVSAANPSDISVYPDTSGTISTHSNWDYIGNWLPYCSPGVTNEVRWYTDEDTLWQTQSFFDCGRGSAPGTTIVPGSIAVWGYPNAVTPASLPHALFANFTAPDGVKYHLTLTSHFSGYVSTSSVPTCIENCPQVTPTSPVTIVPASTFSPSGMGSNDYTIGWQPYCTSGATNILKWYRGDGTLVSVNANGFDCENTLYSTTVPGAVYIWNYNASVIPTTLPGPPFARFFGGEGDFFFTITNGNGTVYRYNFAWKTEEKVNRFDWTWNGTDYEFPNSIPLQTATVTAPVIIIPGIYGSYKENDVWVLDPVTHAFDNLIDTLAANGYTKDKDLFSFPYDWHKSNVDTAILLKQKIDQVKQICQCNKVDLVAHSMGGLVARQYIQSANFENDVRNIIFLGTPHLGSPQDYLIWEGGKLSPTSLFGSFVDSIFVNEAYKAGYRSKFGSKNVFDYIHNFPITSVQELLPTYSYLINSDSIGSIHSSYPTGYPRNNFLEELNANIDKLYSSGVKVTNYIGDETGISTISQIRIVPAPNSGLYPLPMWQHGFPENFTNIFTDQGLISGHGDNMVPVLSSSFVNQNVKSFNADHGQLISASEADIYKTLTGKDAKILTTSHGLLDSLILFHIHSPADIIIIAPDGRKVGKNFTTGEIYMEIPDAFYAGYKTDDEFISIPNPINGEYKLLTQGTGNGEYTLVTDILSHVSSTEAFFVGQTVPGLVTTHNINFDVTHPSNTAIVPADKIPPSIALSQPVATTYTHADLLPVNITVTDATGIATTSVVFDGKSIAASTSIDLFYESLGVHIVSATSTDMVNNSTSTAKNIQVIATASSTISDIHREYSLGWIKSKTLRDLLVTKLNTSVKLQKITDTIVVSTKPLVTKKVDRWVQILDTIILKSIFVDLSLAKSTNQVNAQGYQVLISDVNWILSHN